MDPMPNLVHDAVPGEAAAMAALLERLEACSRAQPQRVLRLRGALPGDTRAGGASATSDQASAGEAFELLIFRGFSSSTTHPTAADPDEPALPPGAVIHAAEWLAAPLQAGAEHSLWGPGTVQELLAQEQA